MKTKQNSKLKNKSRECKIIGEEKKEEIKRREERKGRTGVEETKREEINKLKNESRKCKIIGKKKKN